MKRVKKIYVEDMDTKIDLQTLHTAVATANNEFLILVDNTDKHVIDFRNLTIDVDVGGFVVTDENFHTHKGAHIQSLQLIENQFMYIMVNKG